MVGRIGGHTMRWVLLRAAPEQQPDPDTAVDDDDIAMDDDDMGCDLDSIVL
jgi:hypothetical protein